MVQLRCLLPGALVVLLAVAASAEVVPFDHCGQYSPDKEPHCNVHEVRVTPCPEAARNLPCVLKRGTEPSIQFDFTTENPSNEVKSQAYWKTSTDEKPLIGMDRNACNNTPCPVVENQLHLYNNTISISRKFPPRGYHVKWVMWDDNDSNFECCFIFRIKLVP
ncbi:MD-2-related lipid-recognition protein-like [Hetaerina americana]|uniref:MD-2-related lipid-recognition protein-like n=1 Tax=Hetaerina americana TaxID=62018 RepID=UPI003A7F2D4D